MSHWTVAKIRIRHPNIQLLKQALLVIAKELNAEVVENFEVVGYGNRRQLCQFAIPMSLPYGNGYGVYIDQQTGEVKIFVDDHGAPLTAREFARKLQQYYTALAILSAAQQLGFNVQSVQQFENGILIDLVR